MLFWSGVLVHEGWGSALLLYELILGAASGPCCWPDGEEVGALILYIGLFVEAGGRPSCQEIRFCRRASAEEKV